MAFRKGSNKSDSRKGDRPNTIIGNGWEGGKGSMVGSLSLNLDKLRDVLKASPGAVSASEYGKQIKVGMFQSKDKRTEKSPDFFVAVLLPQEGNDRFRAKGNNFHANDDDVPF